MNDFLSQLSPQKFSKGSAVKKAKGGLDVVSKMIADAVGAREASKLQSIVGQMDLSPKVNFPAAWAGDQKSLQAAKRSISEKETGLQSPGRRKILKQAAASAARSAIPDAISGPLMKMAVEQVMPSSVVIPPESIQAAYASVFEEALGNRAFKELIDNGVELDDFLNDIDYWASEAGKGPKWIKKLQSVVDSVTPQVISKRFGLPEDQVTKYLESNKLNPYDVLNDWTREDSLAYDMIENGNFPFEGHWGTGSNGPRNDWSPLFRNQPDEWWEKMGEIQKARENMSDENADLAYSSYDEVQSLVNNHFRGAHQKLMGDEALLRLEARYGGPKGLSDMAMESLSDSDLELDILDQIDSEFEKRGQP
jgi:hypothetical protein